MRGVGYRFRDTELVSRPRPCARMRLSLRNRLALVFFAITLVAIARALPVRRARAADAADQRAAAASSRRPRSRTTPDRSPRPSGEPRPAATVVRDLVDAAGARSGDRVTLLLGRPRSPGRAAALACRPTRASSAAAAPLPFPVARTAPRATGRLSHRHRARPPTGRVAEAAVPGHLPGPGRRVIVYSAPVSDIVHSVAIVRHEILVAGGIALLLALVGGYLVARALAQRVKRLERAAEKVAAGRLRAPDPGRLERRAGAAGRRLQRRCSASSPSSSRRARSSSPPPRTSCARRSSRSAASSSCSRTRSSTPRRGGASWTRSRDQVERLRKLSVDLLDLSRLESGSLELRPEQVDLGELTRSVSGEFEPTLAQHDSHLELRLPRATIEAQCDPVRVAQIMRILIDNALTHTPPGTRIVVTAGRDDGHVRLAVRDDGEGIDQPTRCRGSSSRSTPPTTPRARGSAWRSPASWPSAWRDGCRSARRRARPCSRSSSRRERGALGLAVVVADVSVGAVQHHLSSASPGQTPILSLSG